jgi:hypothetical protein
MTIDETSSAFRRRRAWPVSPKTDVFLLSALEEVGKTLLGAEWTGEEIEWPWEGYGLSDEQKKTRDAALRRFLNAAKPMHQALLDGVLECRHLPYWAQGKFSRTKPEWWNTRHWLSRFQFGTVDPLKPTDAVSYDEVRDSGKRSYLFVSRSSLDAFLHSLGKDLPGLSPEQHVSPYIRLMLATSARLQITPDNQPSKAAVVAALKEEARDWKRNPPISEALFGMMATLIREPEGQLGKANKPVSPESDE